MLRLAHLSDIHLSPMPKVRRRELINKRLIGYVNWHRGRKDQHQRSALELLTADLKGQHPDHTAVTGDLINIGLPLEYEMALDWLKQLGPPDQVSVVPGNHDAYVRLRHHPGVALWAPYMQGNGTQGHAMPGNGAEKTRSAAGSAGFAPLRFPYVRVVGDVALIGVSSAIPTAPFIAAGRLGGKQRLKLARLLRDHGEAGRFRVLMIHHPPKPLRGNWHRGLRDAGKLLKILEDVGVELVLHGHNHRHELTTVAVPGGEAPVVGVPSASIARHRKQPLARYNLYEIERHGSGFTCTMTGRAMIGASGPVREIARRVLYS